MDKDDKILLICAAVALAAILIWSYEPSPAQATDADQPSDIAYPKSAYLVYNQPYMFAPPVANILPQTASGFLGQTFPKVGQPFVDDGTGTNCGC